MNKTLEYTVCMLIGVVIGVTVAIWVSFCVWEHQAVKHGAGEYNGQTGKFQWKQVQ